MQGANPLRYLFTAFLLLLGLRMEAQVTANLTTRVNMIRVGMPFEAELTVRHPERTIVIFPDSAKDFFPYEVASGKPMPTNTNEGFSEDVKIYQIYNWSIDSAQKFQLPVRFIDAKGDTQVIQSNAVELLYQPEIAAYADSLEFKVNKDIVIIREPIDWLAWLILVSIIVLILALVLIFGSKPIRNWLRRAKIDREYRRYQNQLMSLKAQAENQTAYFPALNKVWRGYFDRDRRYALSALTTTELRIALHALRALDDSDRELLGNLSETSDMVIFAHRQQSSDVASKYFAAVQAVMEKEYRRRKEAIEL